MKVKNLSLIQISLSLWNFIEYNQIAEQNIKKELLNEEEKNYNKKMLSFVL